ncbi:hypothetical protein LguiA_020813 [Lonicera macranthoides]
MIVLYQYALPMVKCIKRVEQFETQHNHLAKENRLCVLGRNIIGQGGKPTTQMEEPEERAKEGAMELEVTIGHFGAEIIGLDATFGAAIDQGIAYLFGMPPHKKPPTALERLRKTKQYVRKKKGKAAPSHDPTLRASPSHGSTPKGTPTQDVTPVASPYTPGEGSSSRTAPQEDNGGPVDKSVLTTFNDHVAYAIWHRTLHFADCTRSVPNTGYKENLSRICRWKPQQCSGDTDGTIVALRERLDDLTEFDGANSLGCNMCAKKQAGIVAALQLLKRVMFGGQTHDSSNAINKAYDISKATSVDNKGEDKRLESKTKSRHDPAATAPTPAATIPAPSRAKPPSKNRPKK